MERKRIIYILIWAVFTFYYLSIFSSELPKRFIGGFYLFMLDMSSTIRCGIYGFLSLFFTIGLITERFKLIQFELKLLPYIVLFYTVLSVVVDDVYYDYGNTINGTIIFEVLFVVLSVMTMRLIDKEMSIKHIWKEHKFRFVTTVLGIPILGISIAYAIIENL